MKRPRHREKSRSRSASTSPKHEPAQRPSPKRELSPKHNQTQPSSPTPPSSNESSHAETRNNQQQYHHRNQPHHRNKHHHGGTVAKISRKRKSRDHHQSDSETDSDAKSNEKTNNVHDSNIKSSHQPQQKHNEVTQPFKFIPMVTDIMKKMLEDRQRVRLIAEKPEDDMIHVEPIAWNWVCKSLLIIFRKYPGGITRCILEDELFCAWEDFINEKKKGISTKVGLLEVSDIWKHFQFIELDDVFEATIQSINPIAKNSYEVVFTDKKKILKGYLHDKYLPLIQAQSQHLQSGQIIRMTGCATLGQGDFVRLLPNEFMVFMIEERRLEDLFPGIQPLSQLFNHSSSPSSDPLFTSAKVVSVESARLKGGKIEKKIKIQQWNFDTANNVDMNQIRSSSSPSTELIEFTLLEGQSHLASLFVPETAMIIRDPEVIKGDKRIEYSPTTMIFIIIYSSRSSQLLYSTQHSDQHPSEPKKASSHASAVPVIDCQLSKERIFVKDLQPNMINLSLYGVVVRVGNNSPSLKGDWRFPIRLRDESGVLDMTIWMRKKGEASHMLEGQSVFFTGVRTELVVHSEGHYIVASVIASSAFFSHTNSFSSDPNPFFLVNNMKFLLTSPWVWEMIWESIRTSSRSPQFLSNQTSYDGTCAFIRHAQIIDYDSSSFTTTVHKKCRRELKHSHICRFCKETLSSGKDSSSSIGREFSIWWKIADSTKSFLALARPSIAQEMVGISAEDFDQLNSESQADLLDSFLGLSFMFSVIQLVDSQGKKTYLIEQWSRQNVPALTLYLTQMLKSLS